MSKKGFLAVLALGLAVTLGAGSLIASNMGFKLNVSLQQTVAGVNKQGKNFFSYPYHATSVSAKNLMDDIAPLASIQSIQPQAFLSTFDK